MVGNNINILLQDTCNKETKKYRDNVKSVIVRREDVFIVQYESRNRSAHGVLEELKIERVGKFHGFIC